MGHAEFMKICAVSWDTIKKNGEKWFGFGADGLLVMERLPNTQDDAQYARRILDPVIQSVFDELYMSLLSELKATDLTHSALHCVDPEALMECWLSDNSPIKPVVWNILCGFVTAQCQYQALSLSKPDITRSENSLQTAIMDNMTKFRASREFAARILEHTDSPMDLVSMDALCSLGVQTYNKRHVLYRWKIQE